MTLLRLSLRNLTRHKRRTIFTSLTLCIGLSMLIVSMGFLDGADRQSFDNLIYYQTAHGKAMMEGAFEDEFVSLDYAFQDADKIVENVRIQSGILAATARLRSNGMLISGTQEIPVIVEGIDLEFDSGVFKTLDAIVAGETLEPGTSGALMGEMLARDMEMQPGDIFTLLVRSAPGALNPIQLKLDGIVATGNPAIDRMNVFLPLHLAREMFILPDGATEIAYKVNNEKKVPEITEQLQDELPALNWYTWRELSADFIGFADLKRIGSGIMLSIFVIMAAVGIGNTMIMAIHERAREIGTLRALGFTPSSINKLFLLEGAYIGIIGGFIAVILGSIVVLLFQKYGMSLEQYGDMDIGYPIRDRLYAFWTLKSVLGAFIFGILLSLIASYGAARRAARGQVVRALREGML
ncbi:FtsX-like permease family protein [bacterium]|nr:FtsX-like permease family protein [bacterium]